MIVGATDTGEIRTFNTFYFPIRDADLNQYIGIYRPIQTNENTLVKPVALFSGEIHVTTWAFVSEKATYNIRSSQDPTNVA